MFLKLYLTENLPPVSSGKIILAATLAPIFSLPLIHTSVGHDPGTTSTNFYSLAKSLFHHLEEVSFSYPVFKITTRKQYQFIRYHLWYPEILNQDNVTAERIDRDSMR
jgi:hypothetical protein